MVYNASIPNSSDLLSNSQPQLLENFSQLNTIFQENHVAFDDATAADRGKHTFLSMIDQVAAPTTAINELALYGKATGGISTLYMRKESNGTEIQMSGPDPVAAATGTSFLPGGIIIQWGPFSGNNAGIVNTFATAFPNNCWSVVATGANVALTSNVLKVTSLTTANFTGRCPNGEAGFYIAIGN